jgi:hypothetical protein
MLEFMINGFLVFLGLIIIPYILQGVIVVLQVIIAIMNACVNICWMLPLALLNKFN